MDTSDRSGTSASVWDPGIVPKGQEDEEDETSMKSLSEESGTSSPSTAAAATVASVSTKVGGNGEENESKSLMQRALGTQLSGEDQKLLIEQLDSDPKLVYHIGLTPAKVYKR